MGSVSTMGVPRAGILAAALALAFGMLLPTTLAAAGAGGTIIGVVSTKMGARPPIRVTTDRTVCGANLPDESIVVDASGQLANVVVTVTGVQAGAPAEVLVSNEKCRFVPRVALVKPGGVIKVTNKDPGTVLHTTHAIRADGKDLFNIALPVQNMVLKQSSGTKTGPLKLVCETHTWMRGWLFVSDELSAISGTDGTFKIENVPAGSREIRVWHEELSGPAQKVTVEEGKTVTVNFTLTK